MKRTVTIGKQNYASLRENDYFYIDKTFFIKEWWESGDDTTLITRPRRFGKTLNMSMTEQFFSVEYQGRSDLFEGLSIWNEEKYRLLQGSYPVLSLSFADIKSASYEQARQEMIGLLVELYKNHSYLMEGYFLKEAEKEFYRLVNFGMEDAVAVKAVKWLCSFLSRYYGKKVIILLDEYDTPMQEAYVHGYWEDIVSFMRSLFNATFKTNPFLERALMTGITRVSKESIFSDLNHLEVVTTISDKYATSFGFTEEEVFTALEQCGLAGEKEEVKRWYDGFVFGKIRDIYNPWSIINFLDKGKYSAYWSNTSGNSLVNHLIRQGNRKVKSSFEQLLQGESIRRPIDEQIVFSQLGDDEEAIWSLLVATGYLKILSYDRAEEAEDHEVMYELAITNYEVRRMFRTMVRGWFREARADYTDFITALLKGNLKEMNIYLNRVTLQVFSYFDTGKGPFGEEPERFYHGFMLGLFVELSDAYRITSNRESGFGRYDVMLEPKREGEPAFVLEFKTRDREEEKNLEETVREALKQIEEKEYLTELTARGIPKERIRSYGFAFEGKKVLIGEAEKRQG